MILKQYTGMFDYSWFVWIASLERIQLESIVRILGQKFLAKKRDNSFKDSR